MLSNLDRLDAVNRSGLLGAPRSKRLDALVQQAADRLGTPIALMSILDDRRTFYAAGMGLDDATTAAREEPADGTYCRYVVALDDVLRVGDARNDELLHDHPATLDGRVRSYLGVPLRENGFTLGSFCVADTAPRTWTDDDIALLAGLASAAMDPAFR